MRQRDLEFPGDPRIFPIFALLGGIPQSRTIQSPFRGSPLRNDNLAVLYAVTPGEIMREAVALVGEAFRRTIGGRRHGASPRRPADWFHAEVVDCQSKPPNQFADSLAVYQRLSCKATRKCALKHPLASLRTFGCSRCS